MGAGMSICETEYGFLYFGSGSTANRMWNRNNALKVILPLRVFFNPVMRRLGAANRRAQCQGRSHYL
jgi:hypothetical protein